MPIMERKILCVLEYRNFNSNVTKIVLVQDKLGYWIEKYENNKTYEVTGYFYDVKNARKEYKKYLNMLGF